ncbi:unannotated protein [freshwater metagenome]|uniref:Unannotated protein n=1 Tax=freshwater metagenome TaxID=449393 RepID=A0A6J5YKD2_9ZZZZ
MKKIALSLLLALTAIGALFLSGCGSSSPKTLTMVLTQPAPVHHTENFGHEPGAIGNLHSFGADLSENGKVVGVLTGERVLSQPASEVDWAIEERIPEGENVDFSKFSVWHQTMSFHLQDRGSIQIEGDRLLVTDANSSPIPFMVTAAQQPLAIVGGTGEFKFARGEVISVRNEDGGYTQTLTYRLS